MTAIHDIRLVKLRDSKFVCSLDGTRLPTPRWTRKEAIEDAIKVIEEGESKPSQAES